MIRLLLALLLLPVFVFAQSAPAVRPNTETRNLLPVPTVTLWETGRLAVGPTWRVRLQATGPDSAQIARRAVERFNGWLQASVPGRRLQTRIVPADGPAELVIRYNPTTIPYLSLQVPDNYSLQVTGIGVELQASSTEGVIRGLATLRQLLTPTGRDGVYFPAVMIVDQPRFPWRGLLIDAARHFMPVATIKRNLDAMEAVKLNVLHWHLSDDQGFRVESKVLPRLHEVSGQYYTQAQVREVIRYAQDRGIRVVPEFDMPGHATSWIAAYPELASNDSTYGVPTRWGVLNISMDPTRETTFQLIDKLLTEMTALFPDEYFHVGGDENDGRQWKRNPRIAAWMRENGFVNGKKQLDKHAAQTYFNFRILQKLNALHKKMVGWDEILTPTLPASAVIESWRGQKGLLDAVKAGHPALLANGYYLDLNHSAADHYAPDPLPAAVAATLDYDQKKNVLGGEAAMWAEFADSVIVDSRIWPRAAAVAERLWSAETVTDVNDMYRRLGAVSAELETLGLQHRRAPEQLLAALAGKQNVAPLRTLAGVLEPVKDYKRHFQGFKYSTETPLTRLVDAAPAEAEAARRFTVAFDSLLHQQRTPAGQLAATPDAKRQVIRLRKQLEQWQQNDARVQPVLNANPSLREYAPLSTQLTIVSTLALQRLEQLEQGQRPTAEWTAAAQKALTEAKKPAGQTELALAVKLEKLLLEP